MEEDKHQDRGMQVAHVRFVNSRVLSTMNGESWRFDR